MPTSEPEVPSPIRSAVEACLLEFGYRYFTHRRTGDLRFFCKTPDEEYRSQFIISEEEKLLRFFIFTDDFFPVEWKPRVYELVHRVNEIVVLGGFAVMWDEQEIFFRISADFRACEPSVESVEHLMNSASFPLKLWEKAFRYLKKGKASPRECVEAARFALDVHDEDEVSKGAKKLVMQVREGAGNEGEKNPEASDPPKLHAL